MEKLDLTVYLLISYCIVISCYLFAIRGMCKILKINDWLKLACFIFIVVMSLHQVITARFGLVYIIKDIFY